MAPPSKIILFVLPFSGAPLHPGSSKPINVQSASDLRMIQDSISEKIPIAVAISEENIAGTLATTSGIVGYGHPEILEQRMDGSLLTLLTCEGKAQLGPPLWPDRPYRVVEGQLVTEVNELQADRAIPFLNLQRNLVRWIGMHVSDPQIQESFLRTLRGPLEVVGAAVSYLIPDPDLQQVLLEINDINLKIDMITRILATVSPASL